LTCPPDELVVKVVGGCNHWRPGIIKKVGLLRASGSRMDPGWVLSEVGVYPGDPFQILSAKEMINFQLSLTLDSQ